MRARRGRGAGASAPWPARGVRDPLRHERDLRRPRRHVGDLRRAVHPGRRRRLVRGARRGQAGARHPRNPDRARPHVVSRTTLRRLDAEPGHGDRVALLGLRRTALRAPPGHHPGDLDRPPRARHHRAGPQRPALPGRRRRAGQAGRRPRDLRHGGLLQGRRERLAHRGQGPARTLRAGLRPGHGVAAGDRRRTRRPRPAAAAGRARSRARRHASGARLRLP